MDSSVSPKDEIWSLRVCHHISNAVYDVTIPFAAKCAQLAMSLLCIPQKITLTEALPYRISGQWVSRGYGLPSFKVFFFDWGVAAICG